MLPKQIEGFKHPSMIETERLSLRPYTLADYTPYPAMCSDPDVVRYVGGDPLPQEDAWNRVLRYAGHWMLLGYGMFAEIEKASGRYVGETGIADFHRGLGNDCDQAGEAAWVFCADIQGRGYAFDAAKAAHGWFSNLTGNPRTVCVIDPENVPSLALARKLGYDAYGEARYKERIAIKLERCAADLR